jgi:DNA-binding PadR family transcriptional regulator
MRQHHTNFLFGFGPRSRRWSEGEPFGDFPFGRGFGRGWGRGWRGERRGERFFDRGDLKYVILELLKEQPRHGYDIIRALEDRARGFYRPSPGSVYPTLQMLEDLGYVTSDQQEGKKVYRITEAGLQYLAEQQGTLDDIRTRLFSGWENVSRPELAELMREMQGLAQALFRHASRGALNDPERLKQLKAVLERARTEVENIGQTTVV